MRDMHTILVDLEAILKDGVKLGDFCVGTTGNGHRDSPRHPAQCREVVW